MIYNFIFSTVLDNGNNSGWRNEKKQIKQTKAGYFVNGVTVGSASKNLNKNTVALYFRKFKDINV